MKRTPLGAVDGCRGYAELGGKQVDHVFDEIDEAARGWVKWKERGRSIVVTLPIDDGNGNPRPTGWEIGWDAAGAIRGR